MAAWNHTKSWTDAYYKAYRNFVKAQASSMMGRTEDCADLSMLLIINFAEQEGLPLTFTDNGDIQYSSKQDGQWPAAGWNVEYNRIDVPTGIVGVAPGSGGFPLWETKRVEIPKSIDYTFGNNYTWKNKDEYYTAVKNRIGAKALYHKNTELNPFGPQSGDLLLSKGHAAIVIEAYLPGLPHPKAADTSIKDWVDPDTAETEINVLEYFRDHHGALTEENKTMAHFDYLNHRGEKKPKAELIYYRRVKDAIDDGYWFRKYNSGVLK
jgi:hypothetical protein